MVSENGGKDLSVPALLDVVRRRKLFVFIPALLVTIAVAGYTYYRPVLYKAQTLMGVESSSRDLIKPDGLPMTIFTATDDTGFEYQAAVPISDTPKNPPRGEIAGCVHGLQTRGCRCRRG